jgi:hypothetical protein
VTKNIRLWQSRMKIARRPHVSRKTVRKAIEAEDGAFSYEREVQPMPRLGAHIADLERLLEENERKPRRERLTLMRLYEACGSPGDRSHGRPSSPGQGESPWSPWLSGRTPSPPSYRAARSTSRR